jgi:hypothetical protein
VINQIRAFLLERGIAVRQGLRALRTEMPIVLAKADKLSQRMIHMIEDLCTDWRHLDGNARRAQTKSQVSFGLRLVLCERGALPGPSSV